MARICVAIPTYNGRALLERYLPSVVEQDAEVVVVDDGSTDGTAAWLAEAYPAVRVVRQPNAGVAAALNRCLDEAAGAEYVLLLNNDVELTPGFAATLADALDRHPEAGSACGKMLALDGVTLDGAGDVVRWSGACWRRGHGDPDDGSFDTPEAVISPCGGAALYRGAALEDVGGFDVDFEAYFEDVDWGLRAQLRGWSCRYEPAAVCLHEGSATTDSAPLADKHALLLRRNSLLLVLKDFPAGAWARHWPRIVWHNLGWLRGSVLEGRGRLHLRAWWHALRLAPRFYRKRRAVHGGRRVGVAELGRVITSD